MSTWNGQKIEVQTLKSEPCTRKMGYKFPKNTPKRVTYRDIFKRFGVRGVFDALCYPRVRGTSGFAPLMRFQLRVAEKLLPIYAKAFPNDDRLVKAVALAKDGIRDKKVHSELYDLWSNGFGEAQRILNTLGTEAGRKDKRYRELSRAQEVVFFVKALHFGVPTSEILYSVPRLLPFFWGRCLLRSAMSEALNTPHELL